MKRIAILGATGSIGTTCLNAIRSGKLDAKPVFLLSASSDIAHLGSEFHATALRSSHSSRNEILDELHSSSPDIVLNAVSGTAGLSYTMAAIDLGYDIALANKESLVLGGRLIMESAAEHGVSIIPVDSEHSAIYSLLRGRRARKLIITASGGPFRDRMDLSTVTVEEALCHPTWKMGHKITIDSATLANKGQEVIEASVLFSFPPEAIDVTVHKESIVHSMIEMDDGAVYALLSRPDMTLPIVSAISGVDSGYNSVSPLSFSDLDLSFRSWDRDRFPMLSLAYEALRLGGSYAIAYAAADEVFVNAFLSGRIPFTTIGENTKRIFTEDWSQTPSSIEEILEIEMKARREAESLC